MSITQRVIRHIFGTIPAPASIQNKQLSIDIGDDGGVRDRSLIKVKDNSGVIHSFATFEEVEDYIQNYVSLNIGTSPFVIVRDASEYILAMESDVVLNIWCDDGSGTGLNPDIPGFSVNVVSSKNIYGAGGVSINYESGGITEPGFIWQNIYYPYSDNGNDIEIKFMDTYRVTRAGGSIIIAGGHIGNNHYCKIHTIETVYLFDYAVNGTGLIGRALLERIESQLEIPLNNAGVSTRSFQLRLWSGKTDSLKYNYNQKFIASNCYMDKDQIWYPEYTGTSTLRLQSVSSHIEYFSESTTAGSAITWIDGSTVQYYKRSQIADIVPAGSWAFSDITPLPAGKWEVIFLTTVNSTLGFSRVAFNVRINGTYTSLQAETATPLMILKDDTFVDDNFTFSYKKTCSAFLEVTTANNFSLSFDGTPLGLTSLTDTTVYFKKIANAITIS